MRVFVSFDVRHVGGHAWRPFVSFGHMANESACPHSHPPGGVHQRQPATPRAQHSRKSARSPHPWRAMPGIAGATGAVATPRAPHGSLTGSPTLHRFARSCEAFVNQFCRVHAWRSRGAATGRAPLRSTASAELCTVRGNTNIASMRCGTPFNPITIHRAAHSPATSG